MSKLLEIFGRAVNIKTSDVIWHWLNMSIKKDDFFEDSQYIEQILDHISNLKFHLADESIEQYLLDFPTSHYAFMAKACLCLKRGQTKRAMKVLADVVLFDPTNTMALYAIGYCFECRGDRENAIKYYQDSIKFKGYLQLPHQRLSAIYLDQGRIDNSITHYKQLCKEYPENTDFQIMLGYLYQINAQYKPAIEAFQHAITMHPDNFQLTGQLDDIDKMIEQNELEMAVHALEEKYNEFGDIPEIHIKLSKIYQIQGNFTQAVSVLKHAIKVQPNNMQANIKLATLYLQNKYYSLAAEQFNRALELNDEIIDAYIGLAMSQFKFGKDKDALDTLSLGSAIQQNSNLLYGECSSLHYAISKNMNEKQISVPIEQMIKSHYNRVKINPENSDTSYKLGLILMAAGDMKSAAKHLENALAINPYHYRAGSKLVICYHECGKNDKAKEILERDVEINQEITDIHYKTALLFCNEKKFQRAIGNLESSMKQTFTTSNSINDISTVLENIGLIDRAAANFAYLEKIYC